jgi:hypothetical protein
VVYFSIKSSRTSDYYVTLEPELPGNMKFVKGVKMEGAVPNPLVFEVNHPSRAQLQHFVSNVVPVFSDLLVKAMRSAGVENFQVFPAVLRNPEVGENWDGYWVFHEIGLIAAASLEKSKADTIMAGDSSGVATPLMGFHTLVLDKEKTRNEAMFRLAEDPTTLLIHERVMAHLRANRPPNGWGFVSTQVEAS